MEGTKTHSVIKCPIKKIIKDPSLLVEIEDAVIRVNKIVKLSYQFISAYLLDCFNKGEEFPEINKTFIRYAQQLVSQSNAKQRGINETREKMKKYYNDYFFEVIKGEDIMSNKHLNKCLSYEEINAITAIQNNITEHYFDYVRKFADVKFETRQKYWNIMNGNLSEKDKKHEVEEMNKKAKKLRDDLVRFDYEFESDPIYHAWILEHRVHIFPDQRMLDNMDHTKENPLAYDIKVSPFSYLPCLFYINNELEKINIDNIKKTKMNGLPNDSEIKLYRVIPQRTRNIPQHITIDSCVLVELGGKEYKQYRGVNKTKASKDRKEKKRLNELWNLAFKMDNKVFHHRYHFSYIITTDNKDCSIIFEKYTKEQRKTMTKVKPEGEIYIDKVKITKKMKKKRLIANDPGLGDLSHLVGYKTHDEWNDNVDSGKLKNKNSDFIIKTRYTRGQRNQDIGIKKFRNQTLEFKKNTYVGKQNITQIESDFKGNSSKSPSKFLEYCKMKNDVDRKVADHYRDSFYRKVKWFQYINTQKSESKFMKQVKDKFGDPEDCLIVYGDWSPDKTKKFQEPAISKRLRKVFRNYGFQVLMIDEYYTSKTCHNCGGFNECFHKHRKKSSDEVGKVWGLLRCTNNNVNCKQIHNRDTNACRNMLAIAQSVMDGKGIPDPFKRPL